MRTYGRGCLPDPVGSYRPARDLIGASDTAFPEAHIGVRNYCPTAGDQGDTEGCVGMAIGHALYARQFAEGRLPIMPSRRAIWYFARKIQGSANSNVGVSPVDAFAAIAANGYPPEWLHPMSTPFAQAPDQEAMRAGADQLEVECGRLADEGDDRVTDLKASLMHGFPVPMALNIDNAYMRNTSGIWTRDGVDGGWHYILATHWERGGVWTLGSYGTSHGSGGYVLVPWADVRDPGLVRDAWAVRFAPPMSEAT